MTRPRLAPDQPLDQESSATIAAAFGLGEVLDARFIARGAMGAVHRLTTRQGADERNWTIKRSFWNHYDEQAIASEIAFTDRCVEAGVSAPRSVTVAGSNNRVLELPDQGTAVMQLRVLEWIEGEAGQRDDRTAIEPLTQWMATIHQLGVSAGSQPIDPWYLTVSHDWDDLASRLSRPEPELARLIISQRGPLGELTELVNTAPVPPACWTHRDLGAENLIWTPDRRPVLIDWENSGPLSPVHELAALVRSVGDAAPLAYGGYLDAGGPARLTEISDLAGSVAVHLNFLGEQAELMLDHSHPEQHEFARAKLVAAAEIPTIASLDAFLGTLA